MAENKACNQFIEFKQGIILNKAHIVEVHSQERFSFGKKHTILVIMSNGNKYINNGNDKLTDHIKEYNRILKELNCDVQH